MDVLRADEKPAPEAAGCDWDVAKGRGSVSTPLPTRAARLRQAGVALAANPRDGAAIRAYAKVLLSSGRFREASDWYSRCGPAPEADEEQAYDPALAAFAAGRIDEAEALLRALIVADQERWRGHFELGRLLQAKGGFSDAIASYENAIARGAKNLYCLMNIGICRVSLGDAGAAEGIFRRCIETDSADPKCWANLSVALWSQRRSQEALDAILQAEAAGAARGGAIETSTQTAIYLMELGRLSEAMDILQKNLPTRPDPMGNYLCSMICLLTGRYAEGWPRYEFRWLVEPLVSVRLRINAPQWRGQDLRGRTILLRPEQGYGDTFHFVRYAPFVKALGATVMLQSWKSLTGVDDRIPGVDIVIRDAEPVPDFDYWTNLMSLPAVFGTELSTIPAGIPYLGVDPELVQEWAPKLDPSKPLKVGLVWAGEPKHLGDKKRSIPLPMLAPLWEVEGVSFHALQKGPRSADADTLPENMKLTKLSDQLRHFGDTAAVMSQLDLVISVDTSVVHLAGGLGRPVWVLLPKHGDFRWLTEGDGSAWYPTARLFRQEAIGDWPSVIDRVARALRDWAASGGPQPARAPASMRPLPSHGDEPAALRDDYPPFTVSHCRVGLLQHFLDGGAQDVALDHYGEWLQRELEVSLSWVKRGGVGLEAGAGVGAHTMALSEALGSTGHLLAYESDVVTRRVLSQNLAANKVGNVTVMDRSLGGPDADPESSDRLDDLLLERIDWLKISARADAASILSGGEETLWRLRPMLMVEVEREDAVGELAERIKTLGYRCWRLTMPLFDEANFNRRPDNLFGERVMYALAAVPEEDPAPPVPDDVVEI